MTTPDCPLGSHSEVRDLSNNRKPFPHSGILPSGLATLCAALAILASEGVMQAQSQDDQSAPVPPYEVAPPDFAKQLVSPLASQIHGLGPSAQDVGGFPVDPSFPCVNWFAQGPGPCTNADANMPPDHPSVGAVQSIVAHPTNPNIIWLAAVNGGVWKTINATSPDYTWQPLTDQMPSLSCGAMVMDPADASAQTLLVASGRRSSLGNNAGGALIGVLRSTDGGSSWSILGSATLTNKNLNSIVVRGNVIMSGSDSGPAVGLYRSVNTGATFKLVSGAAGTGLPSGAVSHLAADPANPSHYYAHVAGVGVFRSTDSGATWANASGGIGALANANVALAVHGVGSTTVIYAATIPGRNVSSQVYRSTNRGTNWTAMDSVLANAAGNHHALLADPTNANLVYISGEYTRSGYPYSSFVARGDASKAAGAQWTQITDQDGFGGSPGNAPHTDSRSLAFDAAGNLLEGNDGGIYRMIEPRTSSLGVSSSNTGAWSSLNNTLQITEMHNMAYDRVADVLFGGTQDNGAMSQQQPGKQLWAKDSNGDASDAAVEFTSNPGFSVRYFSSQFLSGFTRQTRDANNNIISSKPPALSPLNGAPGIVGNGAGQFINPFVVNAVDPLRLLFGAAVGIYESTDQGETVSRLSTSVVNAPSRMAYGGRIGSSTNVNVLYVGSGNSVLVRTNGTGAPVATSTAFPGGRVQGVVMDPADWRVAYVIGSTSVYSTPDAGGSWKNLTGNLTSVGSFYSIEFLTLPGGDAIAVGTSQGVYIMRTANPGAWLALGQKFPNAPVYDLQYDPVDQLLAACTLGRGTWTYLFYNPTYVVSSLEDSGEGSLREAIERVNEGGSGIITFSVTGTISLDSDLPRITGNATIQGPGAADLTIDGGGAHSLFLLGYGTTNHISGLELANALSYNAGASVFNFYGSLTLEDCVISNSYAVQSFGGAVASLGDSSTMSVTNCQFINNTVRGGDGQSLSESASSGGGGGGGAGMGGAIYSEGAALNLSGCSFVGNAAIGGDGGHGGGNGSDYQGGNGGYPHAGIGGGRDEVGGAGAFGGGGGGGGGTGVFDAKTDHGGMGGFGGGGGGAGGARFGGSGGNGGAGGEYGGAGGTSCCSYAGGGGGGAGLGGALFVSTGMVTMVNCSFTGNFATNGVGGYGSFGNGIGADGEGVGGAVFNLDALVTAQNVTYSGNSASTSDNDVSITTVVTSLADSGLGSLRQAIANAAVRPGADTITFATNLSGGVIDLTSSQLDIADTSGPLTITAADLAGGIAINGQGARRGFNIAASSQVTLDSLTVSNCVGSQGGGVNNSGDLQIIRCTITGNSAQYVGGIYNNIAGASLTILSSTVSDNSASIYDGGIFSYGNLEIHHSTIVSNTSAQFGGGVRGASTGNLTHNIIAANVSSNEPDLNLPSASASYNLIGDGTGSGLADGVNGNLVGTAAAPIDAKLGALRNNGGPTFTMRPLASSPAVNAGDPHFDGYGQTDQRGYPRVSGGRLDLGAVESVLQAFYTFDNGSASDATGNTVPAYKGDGISWYNSDHRGHANSAIALNDVFAGTPYGTNNYYLLTTAGEPTNSNRGLGLKSDFTVSAWVWPRVIDPWNIVLGNTGAGVPGTLHFGLANGQTHFGFWGNDLFGGGVLPTGQWTHLAWSYDSHGGIMSIYRNGVLIVSDTGRTNTTKDADVLIGFCEPIAGSYFQGFIDEFAIFNEALTPSQIAALAEPAGPMPDALLLRPVTYPVLNIELVGDQVSVTWTPDATFGRLQSAPSVNGPWTDVLGAVSGQLIPLTTETQFFRIGE